MTETIPYRKLTAAEIQLLESQGCSALNWDRVEVEEGFRPVRVRNTHFDGTVKIGWHSGALPTALGTEKISGIFNAYLSNCTIGRDVRIANVGVHIANYDIGDKVTIENVGLLETTDNAAFGNGVELNVLNEGGGREVILFDELNAQLAYILCLHRYRPKLIAKLQEMIRKYTDTVRSSRGQILSHAFIRSTKEIIDVRVGESACIDGANALVNGTILSSTEAPTTVGQDVIARDFIIAESSRVADGSMLEKTYVGQGCQIGKQFSAENCLFFANCEAYHGEACSVFAGPYTVTHHKSTLLIAGLFSFYNAGSGTNQSNHMYKLGPVHEGRLARGCKTGSFSYMMWPCSVGPFSVVLGKHTGTFDTSIFPFSHHEANAAGKTYLIPGLNISTVGTVRDGAKWPKRDQRRGSGKRDLISFAIFSPYTVGKMIEASDSLKRLQETTSKDVEEIYLNGALIKRLLLRTGQKFYRTGIEMYLWEKVFTRIESSIDSRWEEVQAALSTSSSAVYSNPWVDIAGQLMPQRRLLDLENDIETGPIVTIQEFYQKLQQIFDAYEVDEWIWIKKAGKDVLGLDLDNVSKNDILQIADSYLKCKEKFLKVVTADAEKEYGQPSYIGFGQDGTCEEARDDFAAVRGSFEQNSLVQEMNESQENIRGRVFEVKKKVEKL
jgi:uncharacterized protein DUF4954/uncharacterized protein DUF6819